jgi:hypothetical protein
MFERYTERARRVLFFARYEASQLGSISIETEHLLLGLIREGKGLTSRIFARSHLSLENIRKEIEGRTVFREKVSTSVEIPFSAETKRVLQFAAEEADRLLHNYIGTEHLLLGILREERSVAASILMEKGMRLNTVREDIVQLLNEKTTLTRAKETPLLTEFSRDSRAAMKNQPTRWWAATTNRARAAGNRRRTKNNAVLIRAGVGKTAIVEAWRRRSYGDATFWPTRHSRPRHLADCRRHEISRQFEEPQGHHEGRPRTTQTSSSSSTSCTRRRRGLCRRLARRRTFSSRRCRAAKPAHQRHHAGGWEVSEGSLPRAAVPGHQGRSAAEKETIEIILGVEDRYESFHRRVRANHRGRGVPVEPVHHRPLSAS